MNKICTTVEQSKKLIELGLDINTADMFYNLGESQIPDIIHGSVDDFKCYLLAWSFSALFGLMPQIDEWTVPPGYTNDKHFEFNPKLVKVWDNSIIPDYKVVYEGIHETNMYDNPIDAAFEMICWLLENEEI